MLQSKSSSMVHMNPPKINGKGILASKQVFFDSIENREDILEDKVQNPK